MEYKENRKMIKTEKKQQTIIDGPKDKIDIHFSVIIKRNFEEERFNKQKISLVA